MNYDFLLLGTGIAALSAAEAIREIQPAATVALIGAEGEPPYVRPMLTKLPMARYRAERTYIHPLSWYKEQRIELLLGTKLLALHPAEKTVETDRGTFGYGKCVYALGAYNFIPPFPGRDLSGVHDLRTSRDLSALRRSALSARHAAVIGGGVIGLEAAYLLAEQGLEVTVIETAPFLMPRLLDEASARYLESRMTRFRTITAAKVLRIAGGDRAEAVELEGREPVAAEVVLVSCGVRANSAIAQAAGAAVERAVVVDAHMATTLPDVYACGDCAQFQGFNSALWSQARAEGRVAGCNAAGQDALYSGADTALLLTCPEFSLYAEGDLGKDPNKHYTETLTIQESAPGFAVNPRTGALYERDFYTDGALAGVFLLGDLGGMQQRRQELRGGGWG